MPNFGARSRENLKNVEPALVALCEAAVAGFDCSVLYGHRTPEEQFELFKRGRRLESGVWVVVNRLEVVTNLDGVKEKSMHNFFPARAVDVAPYPINWRDTDRFYYFAGYVKRIAEEMGIPIRWGGDWDGDTELHDQKLYDLPHFELRSVS